MKSKGKNIYFFSSGELLFVEGELSRDLYIVKDGQVRVFKTEGKRQIELDVVGPGGIVGEIAAIDGKPRTATAVALIDTEVYVISAETFIGILEKMPDWFQKIAYILTQRLREVDKKITSNICEDKTNNVGALIYLISCCGKCGAKDNSNELNLKFVENEIMDILGISLTEISSILKTLKMKGIISVNKDKLTILNRDRLGVMEKEFFSADEELIMVT